MNVIKEIVDWAKTLPKWQSDAVRRILTKDALSKDDEATILKLLKAEHGIPSDVTPTPLAEADVAIPMDDRRKVILKSMHTVENVNALAPEQTITFAESGVTVIYGNNAAGKSGYSRVLKKACRARDTTEAILPNISSEGPSEPASAVFETTVGDKTIPEKWVDGRSRVDSLARLMVFDSKCAYFYIDKANEVVFVPYGLHVFPELASLCSRLKKELDSELAAIGEPPQWLSDLTGETAVGKLIAALSDETPASAVNNLATLSSSELEELATLRKTVLGYRATDPRTTAEKKRRLKRRVANLREALSSLESTLSDSKAEDLRNKLVASNTAAEAARLASEEAFKAEPLPGVGSEPWKQLFASAKRYSEAVGYPGKDFPVIEEGSLCVLCQQPLDESARERFGRFQVFVQQDVTQNAEQTRNKFEVALRALHDLDLTPNQADSELLAEIEEIDPELHSVIEQYLPDLRKRSQSIEDACKNNQWDKIGTLPPSPAGKLSSLEERLENEAITHDQVAKPTEQLKIEAQLNELEAREKLAKYKDGILKYISTLQLRQRLRSCVAATDTHGITRRGSDLTKQAVTRTYEKALNNELECLGAKHLRLAVKRSGDLGSTLHRLEIDTATRKVNLSGVLSEGEQCVVAIASFLAEVSTAVPVCAIVLDDPVCSLDHEYRERVANRLVSEGANRQVIVFTHDIVFLLAIEAEAAAQQVPLLVQCVRRSGEEIGICDTTLPWHAMSVGQRVGHLKDLLQTTRATKNKGEQAAFEALGARIYGLLRETWERAVEERLLNDTVQRFRPSVETQKIRRVVVEDSDFVRIDAGMKKCSTWLCGHDEAAARSAPFPAPDEIAKDIEDLEDYLKEIKQRQDKAEKLRKEKLKAPQGQPAKVG